MENKSEYVISTSVVTVKQYIKELRDAQLNDMEIVRKHFSTVLEQWTGVKYHGLGIIKPASDMAKKLGLSTVTYMKGSIGPLITELAVKDLIEFITEYGVKAYDAEKEDLKDAGKNPFLKHTWMLADTQDIFIVTTDDFLKDNIFKKVIVPPLSPLPVIRINAPEDLDARMSRFEADYQKNLDDNVTDLDGACYSNPLSVIDDESGASIYD